MSIKFLTFNKTISIINNYKIKKQKKQFGGEAIKKKRTVQSILKNLTINNRETRISL
tara:strand:- start:731 stop:901 length:171 start_codon:yes stop_codon:yes gene_type:complete